MAKDYVEDESGAKFPLNHTFDGVNNFVFSTGVMFEDLQALCLGLVVKLVAAQHGVHLTALRRGLALSILFNVILLAVVLATIGGR